MSAQFFFRVGVVLSLQLLLMTGAWASSSEKIHLFSSLEPLELKLSYDIRELQLRKAELREEGLEGELTVNDKILKIRVAPRGNGSFHFCTQPQLRLLFNSSDSEETPFAGIKKLKLFTFGGCVEPKFSPAADTTILTNYLIYRFQDEVFQANYKTRLAWINYTDTSGTTPPYRQAAFFLEPGKSVKQRLSLTRIEKEDVTKAGNKVAEALDPSAVSLMHAFQFFIGNFDYGVPGVYSHILNNAFPVEKNIHLFADSQGRLYPFSFDFDFSRFTNFARACTLSGSFFMGSPPSECLAKNIKETIAADLKKFKFASDVTANLAHLRQAFARWRSANQDLIDRLNPSLLQNQHLDAFIAGFSEAVEEAGTAGH